MNTTEFTDANALIDIVNSESRRREEKLAEEYPDAAYDQWIFMDVPFQRFAGKRGKEGWLLCPGGTEWTAGLVGGCIAHVTRLDGRGGEPGELVLLGIPRSTRLASWGFFLFVISHLASLTLR